MDNFPNVRGKITAIYGEMLGNKRQKYKNKLLRPEKSITKYLCILPFHLHYSIMEFRLWKIWMLKRKKKCVCVQKCGKKEQVISTCKYKTNQPKAQLKHICLEDYFYLDLIDGFIN